MVYEFATERMGDHHYTDGLSIVSTLRQDLEKLRQRLDDLRESSGGPEIHRIVLYIDDLDRCDPKHVVEVLQAVHLLLAFDLFAVIVAVDARWLERSLYTRYLPDYAGMTDEQLAASEFSPQNYLEKIFQIPYHIPPMGEGAFDRLIDSLMPRAQADWPVGAAAPVADPAPEPEPVAMAEPEPEPESKPEPEAKPPPRQIAPLTFLDHEAGIIKRMVGFLATPRAAKRLVNVYALVRMQAPRDLAAELKSPDAASATALATLLALDIAHPRIARLARQQLRRSPEPLDAMILRLLAEAPPQSLDLRRQLTAVQEGLQALGPLPDASVFRNWVDFAERFSFSGIERA